MKPEDLNKELSVVISQMVDSLNKASSGNQSKVYSRLLELLQGLELDSNGNIKTNTKNLKVINDVRSEVNNLVLNKTYKNKVNTFLNRYDDVEAVSSSYFKSISSAFTNRSVFNKVKGVSVDLARESLLKSGIQSEVVDEAVNIIRQNIVSGGKFADLQKQLRLFMLGDEERLGKLQRYVKQISKDAVNQYSANYIQVVSEDLGLVFYKYIGTNKDTSRQFCIERVGGYYHIDEIEEWGKGVKTDSTFKEPNRGTWPGRIPGTNSSNILTFRGGFNCDDKFIPLDSSAVPSKWIKRAESLGFVNGEI